MTINWSAVFGWTVFVMILLGIISGAVSLILLVRNNRKMKVALYDMRELMRVQMGHTKVAADRTLENVHEAEKVKEKIDKLTDQVAGDSSKFEMHYKPPLPPTACKVLFASGFVLAAFTLCGASVRLMEGPNMPISAESVQLFDTAVQAHHDGRYAAARETYRRAAGAGYSVVYALDGVAECSFYLGDYAATMRACEDLLNTPGGAGRGRYWRGNVLLKQGRESDACLEFQWSHREGYSLGGRMLTHLSRAANAS